MTPQIFIGLRPQFKQAVIDSGRPIHGRMLDVSQYVCDYFKIRLSDVITSTRKREVVNARQISMYLIHQKTNATLQQIGSFFGNRDHSTVIYSIGLVNDLIDTDKSYKADISKLKDKTRLL